jgi:hypothetical protein
MPCKLIAITVYSNHTFSLISFNTETLLQWYIGPHRHNLRGVGQIPPFHKYVFNLGSFLVTELNNDK